DAVARNDDRYRVACQRLPDRPRRMRGAEVAGNLAVACGLAPADGADESIHFLLEGADLGEVEPSRGKIGAAPRQIPMHLGDHLLDLGWRVPARACSPLEAALGCAAVSFRQLQSCDAAFGPGDAAGAERRFEQAIARLWCRLGFGRHVVDISTP